jgi:hypothetical protein
MSTRPDHDRSIAAWLVAEAPEHAPDGLLESSREHIRLTRQRRAWGPARRIQDMNAYAKFALAAAAVLIVAVVGINLAPGVNDPGAASPTGSPLASPIASPSAAPSEAVAPQPPVEFTGTIACGPPVRSDTIETLELDDGMLVARNRDGAWQQIVTMSDQRLEGAIYHTWEADTYKADATADEGPQVAGYTRRITNDGGIWESRGREGTFADGSSIGEPPDVFVGSGGYEGLIAIYEVTEEREQGCVVDVRGIIFEGAPIPEPYVVE